VELCRFPPPATTARQPPVNPVEVQVLIRKIAALSKNGVDVVESVSPRLPTERSRSAPQSARTSTARL